VQRLVDQLVAGQVDCVTFTSAPAVTCVIDVATERGKREAFLEALRTDVLAACVGPVTASGLEKLGITTVQPERSRLGALVRAVVEELPARRARTVRSGSHVLTLRGHSVLVDGSPVSLTARQSAVLSTLLDAGPGRVLSRAELLQRAWRDEVADEHAVEMTVARLRSALGPAGKTIETVVKRGYRLASQSDLADVREM
jgi:uroporphyrinogen-III synthase